MTTSRASTGLSREQMENLLILGGWQGVIGGGWFGMKREGVAGVVFFDLDYDPPKLGFEPDYTLEPGDDLNTNSLRWTRIINSADLAAFANKLLEVGLL